jgi:hypothetical protein
MRENALRVAVGKEIGQWQIVTDNPGGHIRALCSTHLLLRPVSYNTIQGRPSLAERGDTVFFK